MSLSGSSFLVLNDEFPPRVVEGRREGLRLHAGLRGEPPIVVGRELREVGVSLLDRRDAADPHLRDETGLQSSPEELDAALHPGHRGGVDGDPGLRAHPLEIRLDVLVRGFLLIGEPHELEDYAVVSVENLRMPYFVSIELAIS